MKTLEFTNGDRMPVLGLGTWKSSPGDVYNAVKDAIRFGYRHIDCAAIYGNESEIGQALSESFAEGIVSRDELWITSKLWNNAHAPEDAQSAIEKTLSDLQIEHLDLYLMHWPIALKKEVTYHSSAEDFIPLDELPVATTWQAMEKMVGDGLCNHIGVSNFSIDKLSGLLETADIKPEMNQIELHPYLQQNNMLEFCDVLEIPLTAYAPLGSADRPDRLKVDNEPVLLKDPVIVGIAEKIGVTPAQVLISWAIHRDTVVIPKSVNPERLKQNLAAADVALGAEDMQNISELDRHRRYVNGEFWAVEGGPYTLENLWDEE